MLILRCTRNVAIDAFFSILMKSPRSTMRDRHNTPNSTQSSKPSSSIANAVNTSTGILSATVSIAKSVTQQAVRWISGTTTGAGHAIGGYLSNLP
ncbi:hypothetical protein H6G17_26340 [Chroococcidiopsis sp. FACHB-1243]|uniref:hypothetical protein n=1 Tax=Chroococcidiopsis sp. [FACHB-1243] TaxID=2692781 RepID=UPI00177F6AF2|nr:hypothetical protein [Chroococcidiopsis sp. [FACHB-1243]]MBD2308988.1 hypothetical protein [Chroococcidiopsis sp. [FACHB-1243]]